MRKPRFVLLPILVAIVGSLEMLSISIDLTTHPWLYQAASAWKWWNYFTSEHTLTILWILHPLLAVFVGLGFSTLFAAAIWINEK